MRVASYYRVSSTQQREAGTIESQRTAARALVAARGYDLVAEYEDDGHSARAGKLQKRTGFLALLDDARARRFDAVIVVAFDRLTRAEDMAEMGSILGTLQGAGVRVITAGGEETDLGTFGGRISALVRAQLAAEESAVKSDRARRGHQRTAASGRPPCAPPLGLRFDRDGGRWTESPAAAIVREMFKRIAAGESGRKVAQDLAARRVPMARRGLWIAASVSRLVNCTAYDTGLWRPNRSADPIKVPILVDAELAARARANLASRRHKPTPRTTHIYLLEALATCGACGSPILIHSMVRRGRDGTTVYRYSYYVCRRRRYPEPDPCDAPTWRTDQVDAAVWAEVQAQIEDPDLLRESLRRRGVSATEAGRQALADTADWRARLDGIGALVTEALTLRDRGLLTARDLEERLRKLAARREMLERQLAQAADVAAGAREEAAVAVELGHAIEQLRAACGEATLEERREIVRRVCRSGLTLWPNGQVTGDAEIGEVVQGLRVAVGG